MGGNTLCRYLKLSFRKLVIYLPHFRRTASEKKWELAWNDLAYGGVIDAAEPEKMEAVMLKLGGDTWRSTRVRYPLVWPGARKFSASTEAAPSLASDPDDVRGAIWSRDDIEESITVVRDLVIDTGCVFPHVDEPPNYNGGQLNIAFQEPFFNWVAQLIYHSDGPSNHSASQPRLPRWVLVLGCLKLPDPFSLGQGPDAEDLDLRYDVVIDVTDPDHAVWLVHDSGRTGSDSSSDLREYWKYVMSDYEWQLGPVVSSVLDPTVWDMARLVPRLKDWKKTSWEAMAAELAATRTVAKPYMLLARPVDMSDAVRNPDSATPTWH